jgi:hypothetical protein
VGVGAIVAGGQVTAGLAGGDEDGDATATRGAGDGPAPHSLPHAPGNAIAPRRIPTPTAMEATPSTIIRRDSFARSARLTAASPAS